jgi:hypothetical protein
MSNSMELEITKVVNIEFNSVEDGVTGLYREIIIESENGNLTIKLYAHSDPSDIKVLI